MERQLLLDLFQSTLPVWGATVAHILRNPTFADFNPRSPCGERPPENISNPAVTLFQSTLPVWGATPAVRLHGAPGQISIHAPRVGSDDSGFVAIF